MIAYQVQIIINILILISSANSTYNWFQDYLDKSVILIQKLTKWNISN